jgi:hypothetical protein
MNIHSCSYHCHRPACIKAQRDELYQKYTALLSERDALLEALAVFVDDFCDDTGMSAPHYEEVNKARALIEAAKRQEDV